MVNQANKLIIVKVLKCMIFESLEPNDFIHKVPLTLSKWINGIVSIPSKRIFFFSLLILIYFFNYETIVIKSAKSFALSDPNLSSVQ